MNIFDRLDAMSSRSIDRMNGERFRLTPMVRRPNGRAMPQLDGGRQIIVGLAVFEMLAEPVGVELGNRSFDPKANDLKTTRIGRTPVLSIDRRELAGQAPRQGDVVTMIDRADAPSFEIVAAMPDGHARIVLKLVGRD